MNIEQKKKEFEDYVTSNEQIRDFISPKLWQFIEQALKEIQETTCKEMIVEEREKRIGTGGLIDKGFNQCCALGRENEKKIKNELKFDNRKPRRILAEDQVYRNENN